MSTVDNDLMDLSTEVIESITEYIGVELDGAMERTKLVDKVMHAIHEKYHGMLTESEMVVRFSDRMKESEARFKDRMKAIDEVDEELTELEDMVQQLECYAEHEKFTLVA